MASTNKSAPFWYHENLPLAKGCERCADLNICGGLRVSGNVESCLSFCSCTASKRNPTGAVCKCDPAYFVQRKREVNGWNLNVEKTESLPHSVFPIFVPMIYGRSRRLLPFRHEAVAVPIHRLMSNRTGDLLIQTRSDLCSRVLLDPAAKVIVTGVHYDQTLENYWSKGRSRDIAAQLRNLNPDLVTTPNFSVFPDVQRWDNFHNMKRIAICWYELMSAGNPTALHVNARTPRDYHRWIDFLNEHTEIEAIAFEFQTGTASPVRAADHVTWLQMIAARVRHPLSLFCLGGLPHLNPLLRAFESLVHISATPFMRTSHYKKLVAVRGAGNKLQSASTDMAADDLLPHNIRIYSTALLGVVAGAA